MKCKYTNTMFPLLHIAIVTGGSRTATTSKMESFVIIVNGWKSLTVITKHSILDVAVVLDPPLVVVFQLLYWIVLLFPLDYSLFSIMITLDSS